MQNAIIRWLVDTVHALLVNAGLTIHVVHIFYSRSKQTQKPALSGIRVERTNKVTDNLHKGVAKYIALAQIASDGGKYLAKKETIYHLLPIGKLYYDKGYKSKDTCIAKAIHLINTCKNSGFYYYVKSQEYGTTIVYFNFKIGEKRHQVSFHTFSKRFDRFSNKKCATKWDHKSSRYSSAKLATISKCVDNPPVL